VQPLPQPPSASTLDDSNAAIQVSEESTTTALAVGIVGGVIVAGLACAIGGFGLMRRRIKKMNEEKAKALEEADAKLEAMAERMTRLNQVMMMSSKAASSASLKVKEKRGSSRCKVHLEGDLSSTPVAPSGDGDGDGDGAGGANPIQRARTLTPGSGLRSGACLSDSSVDDAAQRQAAWTLSQEHAEKSREEAEDMEDMKEAIQNRDLDAIDASLDSVVASIKEDADRDERGMGV